MQKYSSLKTTYLMTSEMWVSGKERELGKKGRAEEGTHKEHEGKIGLPVRSLVIEGA